MSGSYGSEEAEAEAGGSWRLTDGNESEGGSGSSQSSGRRTKRRPSLGGSLPAHAPMEASLTCAVCLSLFEEPVTLPVCSHNFCRPCVLECLSLARSAAEPPPPSSPAASRPLPRSPGRPPEPGRASSRAAASAASSPVFVSCPLCRKLCPLPPEGGAAALPVNTTLAEVVKLFRAGQSAMAGREAAPDEASLALAPQLAALGVACGKHPGRPLQLYCRMCLRGGCGQCVSEEHRGLFHSVNLIDVVYQEEKLAFFSNLKKIRELHLNLLKEITSPKEVGVIMQNEEEIIKTEFEKVYNALEMRKKQLLEDLESQKQRREKECLIWKRMKEVHRKTIENVLNDCDKLLDESDPQCFLEVACNLNQRMKTQLELGKIASRHENPSECKQKQVDTTSIINDISALNLTVVNLDPDTDIPPRGSACSLSANSGNKWEDKKNEKDAFCPVAGEDTVLDNGRSIPTQYMSISETAEFGSMSHEEVRYNYYMKHQMRPGELQAQLSPLNEKHTLSKSPSSKHTSVVRFCLSAKAKYQKKRTVYLSQKQNIKGTSLSDSVGFTYNAQDVTFISSGSNNNLHQLNVKEPQNDSKEISLSKDTKSCLNAANIPLLHAVKVPSETHLSLNVFPKVSLSAATSAATLNLCSFGDAAELPTAPLDSSSNGNMTTPKRSNLSFKKESEVFSTLFLGKSVTQDCNTSNINGYNSKDSVATATTTITGPQPVIPVSENLSSAFSINFKSDYFQKTKPSSSDQTSFSFIFPVEKIVEENKAACFSMDNNIGNNCSASSTVGSAKDLVCDSSIISNLASKTSCSAFDQKGALQKPAMPTRLPSKNFSWTNDSPCVFSFKGTMENSCDTLTMKPLSKIEYTNDKPKMEPKEKYSAEEKSVPSVKDVTAHQELKPLMCCSSSPAIDNYPKSETANTLVPQENVDTINSTLALAKPIERTNRLENPVLVVEDQRSASVTKGASCTINSESDLEDLSQASSASDSSSTSEYFSVAEDKTLPS